MADRHNGDKDYRYQREPSAWTWRAYTTMAVYTGKTYMVGFSRPKRAALIHGQRVEIVDTYEDEDTGALMARVRYDLTDQRRHDCALGATTVISGIPVEDLDDSPCIVCGAYAGTHDDGCMAGSPAVVESPFTRHALAGTLPPKVLR